jgi:hypothetical protein
MVGRRGDRHLSNLAGRQRTRGDDDLRWVGEQYEEIHMALIVVSDRPLVQTLRRSMTSRISSATE